MIRFLVASALAAAGIGMCAPSVGSASEAAAISRLSTIQIPGKPLTSFDISWFDPTSGFDYVTDRSNTAVDIIDTAHGVFAGRIPGFAGTTADPDDKNKGPNGVVTTAHNQLWVTDGNSMVRVVDLATRTIVDSISTGGRFRADSIAYDPRDDLVLVANDNDAPPFVTLISADPQHRAVVAKLPMPTATNGIEASVWDPSTGVFLVAVPQIGTARAHGVVLAIDPKLGRVTRTLPVSECQPAGVARGPTGHLLLGCSDDATGAGFAPKAKLLVPSTGRTREIGTIGGFDEVWYNPGDKRFYLASRVGAGGPMLAVIDAVTEQPVAAVATGKGAHSVAVDPRSNQAFVPLGADASDPTCSNGCIAVFGLGPVAGKPAN